MKLPQLTLRELFLLVALAAMGCGWWRDQARINKIQADLREAEADLQNRSERIEAEFLKRLGRTKKREKVADEVLEYLLNKYPDQRDKIENAVGDIFLKDNPFFPFF